MNSLEEETTCVCHNNAACFFFLLFFYLQENTVSADFGQGSAVLCPGKRGVLFHRVDLAKSIFEAVSMKSAFLGSPLTRTETHRYSGENEVRN